MEFYKYFIFGIIAFIIGIFAFSNIFLTLFYTIPRLKREKREGNLIVPVSLTHLILPIIFWTIILSFGLYYSFTKLHEHIVQICSGLVIAFIVLVIPSGKKSRDMNDDFNRIYKDKLKYIK